VKGPQPLNIGVSEMQSGYQPNISEHGNKSLLITRSATKVSEEFLAD
jgi:hypothetical protein